MGKCCCCCGPLSQRQTHFLILFIFLQKFIKFRGTLVKDATPRSKTRCKFRSYVRSIYFFTKMQLYLINLFSINLSSEKFLKHFLCFFAFFSLFSVNADFFDVVYVLSLFFQKTLSNICYQKIFVYKIIEYYSNMCNQINLF